MATEVAEKTIEYFFISVHSVISVAIESLPARRAMQDKTSDTAVTVTCPGIDPSLAAAAVQEHERRLAIDDAEPRNLFVLSAFQVLLRIGWIFKTETVIMPDFVDAIAGAGWVRGLLPVLNRVGQSLPPLCLAENIQRSQSKTRMLLWITLLMAVPFLALGTIWAALTDQRQPWLPPLFLVLYFLFFALNGLNQQAFGTAQGKLIRAVRRGHLMGVSGLIGSVSAVVAAIWLLPGWLRMPNNAGYAPIFLFNGGMYLVGGLALLLAREPADPPQVGSRTAIWQQFVDAWRLFRSDAGFRSAGWVSMCFISALLLFPHYQWLGREKLGATNADLLPWVVAQNLSLGVFSPLLGRIADRRGNRLAVRIAVFLSAFTPLVALWLASRSGEHSRTLYALTFALLGLCPLTIRTIQNYVLELADESRHSLYLSTMTVCLAVPFVLSPIVGWLVDVFPYQWTFGAISAVIALGGVLTFRMPEPRLWTEADNETSRDRKGATPGPTAS
ncbi:MAG: MFS transporter [Planctomycetaceae bacterium]